MYLQRVLHAVNGTKLTNMVLLYSYIPIYGRLLARYRVDKIMTPPAFPIGFILGSQEQTHPMRGRSFYPGYAGLASPAWQKRPRQLNLRAKGDGINARKSLRHETVRAWDAWKLRRLSESSPATYNRNHGSQSVRPISICWTVLWRRSTIGSASYNPSFCC